MAIQVRDVMSNLRDLTFLQVCWYAEHHPFMSSTRLDANSHLDHSDNKNNNSSTQIQSRYSIETLT